MNARVFLAAQVTLLLVATGVAVARGVSFTQRADANDVERNKAIVRRWIEEGFNRKNVNVVDDLFGDDFAVSGQRIGRAGLKQVMNQRLAAFPDLHVSILEILGEGDKVVIWYSAEGTQRGEFDGVRPTGKRASWLGSDILRIERGTIVEARFLDDALGLLRQLGATLTPP